MADDAAYLAALPAPTVIEEVSFETILASMKADLSARLPDIAPVLALESSAAVKVMEACAYRETLLRARINDAARANLLAFATGADLDHVGANSSPAVSRMAGEADDRFRLRILLATQARNVGSPEFYRLVALNTDLTVKDAIAYRDGRDPTVNVAVLSTATDGVAGAGLLAEVTAAFADPANRLVNGVVNVVSAVASVVNIAADLTVTPNTPASITATAESALRAAWAAEGGLGRDLTRDWIKARLMVPGIYYVALSGPAADQVVPPHAAISIGTVTLTIGEENS